MALLINVTNLLDAVTNLLDAVTNLLEVRHFVTICKCFVNV